MNIMKYNRTCNQSIRGKAWLGILIPLALIAIAAGVFLLIKQNDKPDEQPPLEPQTLQVGIGWGLYAFAGAVLLSIIASLQVQRLERLPASQPPPEGAS